MKKLTPFFLLLVCCLGLFGQGAFLQPFGSSYVEVQEFLEGQDLAQADFDKRDQITVWTEDFKIAYHFSDGHLYKTETVRNYPNRKVVLAAISGIRSHYQRLAADEMVLNPDKNAQYLAFLFQRELHELSQIDLGKQGFQLKQVKLDLEKCPRPEISALRGNQQLLPLWEGH